ncbi:energy transducer TonB [Dokdonia sp. Hel_I_53]|uniref:energy transducer TonB n=1 Tax=Dokdonia sp. Hel_I_53 TaxID=1566287 RepID=UPI00119B72F2|nr:energy transducer TonB [Dokdonia sp. Hel_I_53]TVZ52879.1 hypothetical protein OD90_2065 [Dokdonia sp. Hel_I_53]
MKRSLYRVVFICTAVLFLLSCDQLQTKKIESSQYLAEDWKAINLNEVDVYPTFEICNNTPENEEMRLCFEKTVTSIFYEALNKHQVVVSQDLEETVVVDFVINKKGNYCIDTLRVTEAVRFEIPELEQWIHEAARELPKAFPARKEGVPVKTRFKIPVIFKVEE